MRKKDTGNLNIQATFPAPAGKRKCLVAQQKWLPLNFNDTAVKFPSRVWQCVRSQQRGKTAEVPGIFSEMTFILSTGFQEKEKIQNILEDKTNKSNLFADLNNLGDMKWMKCNQKLDGILLWGIHITLGLCSSVAALHQANTYKDLLSYLSYLSFCRSEWT